MENIFGTKEELKLYDKNRTLRYEFYTGEDGVLKEAIYNHKGQSVSFKDATGYWGRNIRDEKGKVIDFAGGTPNANYTIKEGITTKTLKSQENNTGNK